MYIHIPDGSPLAWELEMLKLRTMAAEARWNRANETRKSSPPKSEAAPKNEERKRNY